MDVQFLGGADEIGRSAVLIDESLLLDFGMLTDSPPQFPVRTPSPDAVVVSHGHLDHVGTIPALVSGDARPPIHWTPPTYELALTLARDTLKLHGGSYNCPFTETHVRRMTQQSAHHDYGEPFEAAGHEVTFYNAGHIPGSAHVLVDDGDTRLLYTADFHTDDQRLVAGTTARPDADAVICESTYSDVDHDPRETVEGRFVESVETTLGRAGPSSCPPSQSVEHRRCCSSARHTTSRVTSTGWGSGDRDARAVPRVRPRRGRAPAGEVARPSRLGPRRPAKAHRPGELGHRDDERDALWRAGDDVHPRDSGRPDEQNLSHRLSGRGDAGQGTGRTRPVRTQRRRRPGGRPRRDVRLLGPRRPPRASVVLDATATRRCSSTTATAVRRSRGAQRRRLRGRGSRNRGDRRSL